MLHWIRTLDRVLRGHATTPAALADGEINVPVWGLLVLIDAMGLIYGLCMSAFEISSHGHNVFKQTISCMFKVPALFLLTLLVTFPSLYLFNAMLGSRLTVRAMMKLLISSLAVMLAVLVSIGPIVAFFSFTTTSYSFMILLNVAVGGVAGLLGMKFLLQTLHRMAVFTPTPVPPPPPFPTTMSVEAIMELPINGPLDPTLEHPMGQHVRLIFRIWVLVFALVGTQMAWVLSPFIGHPNGQFEWFRPTGSNFFQGVINNIHELMH